MAIIASPRFWIDCMLTQKQSVTAEQKLIGTENTVSGTQQQDELLAVCYDI